MKSLIRFLTTYLALMTTVLAAPFNADTIFVINYQATNAGLEDVAGTFSGKDTNADGWLSAFEVTDWYTSYDVGATYSSLNDIGDFDIFTREWLPNALQWDKLTRNAYVTWNNWSESASEKNVQWNWNFNVKHVQGTPQVSTVPAPPALILMLTGLGLLSLSKRFRKEA